MFGDEREEVVTNRTRARTGKRYVELTEDDASKVVSDAAWVSGCPFCAVFGDGARREYDCDWFASHFGYWKRTPDQIAGVIHVPRARGRR